MSFYRYVMLSFVAISVLIWASVGAALNSAFTQFGLHDAVIFGLVSTTGLVSIAVGLLSFFLLIRNEEALRFTDEVVRELSRVTWPSKEETTRSTTVVIVTAVFVAGVLGIYDLVWKNVADMFLFASS